MNPDYFSKRTTIRNFSNKKIPNSVINSILESAMRAPTCGNMQLYSVIITRNSENKNKLAPLHFNQPAAVNADIILTICADFNRFTRWAEISDAKPGYNNFHSFMMACTDAIILTQQIATVAEMQGLGTCWLGTVNYNAKEISNLLNLPDMVIPVASLALGYPAGEAKQPERLPLEAWVHEERYRDDSDEVIKSLHKEKENFDANIKFVTENNKKTLAQVFTDIRYPKEVNEAVSRSFMNLLRDKGFLQD